MPLPQAALQQLFALFNARRYAAMEELARQWAVQHPESGAIWKALGVALLSQRKDALPALRRAVALLPQDPEALSSLGGACVAVGQHQEAADCYRRALVLQPKQAYLHSNLADVYVAMQQFDAAEASGRQALSLMPQLAAAHVNLGRALLALGRVSESRTSLETALKLEPRQAVAHRLLARIYQDEGRTALALGCIEQALVLDPDHVDSLVHRGQLLLANQQAGLALQSLERARELQPSLAERHADVGQVLLNLGQADAAARAFEAALRCAPEQAEAHSNLGSALLALGRPADAIEAFSKAVALRPDAALLHSNLGNALQRHGRFVDAVQCHREALRLGPDLPVVHSNLAHALKVSGQIEEAVSTLTHALRQHVDRDDLRSQDIFLRQYFLAQDDNALQSALQVFGQRMASRAPATSAWDCTRVADKRLRVGLLSADLRAHPVGYFLGSVLAAGHGMPGKPIEWVAYANSAQADEVSRHLHQHVDLWRDATVLSDEALHDQIRTDQIDVLMDLSGHSLHNRLPVLARKPAPVQVSWLGYCASTGLHTLDAFLADPWIAPQGTQASFTEPLILLPETFLCFTPPTDEISVSELPALKAPGIRFGCFNDPAKVNPGVVEVWARLLNKHAHGTLLMQGAAFADEQLRAAMLQRFARHGVGLERLELRASQPRRDYLASYREVDICLDPFPYPGGTTTMESLWMGVPVLTLPGQSALSRQGLSILKNLGLDADWVALDTDDYVARAASWAQNLPALAALRSGLRPRLLDSNLCQADRFARHLESTLRDLWRRYCEYGR
jgi:predicted O-linked N-acetylglucosamine transferase (SPINDLY family)